MSGAADTRAALDAAYRAACYRLLAPPVLSVQIGVAHPALAARLRQAGADGAAWLTAVNPGSQRLDARANAARLAALDACLHAGGWTVWPALARDPSGAWPDEASRMVPGLPRAEAEALGRRFGQNALLWIDSDGRPELVWLV